MLFEKFENKTLNITGYTVYDALGTWHTAKKFLIHQSIEFKFNKKNNLCKTATYVQCIILPFKIQFSISLSHSSEDVSLI